MIELEAEHWSTAEAAAIVGITYRQASYWCEQGLIPGQPSDPGSGAGGWRRWTTADIDRARLVLRAALLRQGTLADTIAILETER